MGAMVRSIIESGMSGIIVEVECHQSNGLPAIIIVGSASRSVDEAKERMRGAFASSNLKLPKKRITINLAPGDIPKESTGLDLAMAASILVAGGIATAQILQQRGRIDSEQQGDEDDGNQTQSAADPDTSTSETAAAEATAPEATAPDATVADITGSPVILDIVAASFIAPPHVRASIFARQVSLPCRCHRDA